MACPLWVPAFKMKSKSSYWNTQIYVNIFIMNEVNKNRQSIRLKHFDYSQQGLYFVTICTHKMHCLFGKISQDEMHLNDAGKMIESHWQQLKSRFNHISLQEFLVMPNHFHGIIEIIDVDKPLGEIIGAFKSLTTNA